MAEAFGIVAGILSLGKAVFEGTSFVCELYKVRAEILLLQVSSLQPFRG